MELIALPRSPQPEFYRRIISVLKVGGVVALPTDTVYGLACDPRNQTARTRILKIKSRASWKPLTLFLSETSQIKAHARIHSKLAQRVIDSLMPGGLTLILEARDKPLIKTPDGSIGIRVPNMDWLRELARQLGGLATTSANLAGRPVASSPKEIADSLPGVDLIIDGGTLKTLPSTVLDLRHHPFLVRRRGIVPILEIEAVIGRKVKLSSDVYFSILLVCTGNLCRSPIAQGLLEKETLGYPVFIYSAGTDAVAGAPPTPSAVKAAARYDIDIAQHRSTPLSRELINAADLILVMTQSHYQRIVELMPRAELRVRYLRSYPKRKERFEIPDPIGAPYPVYEKVARICANAVRRVARDAKLRYLKPG
jgi:L-threonylcarbamoyladenylate synthase